MKNFTRDYYLTHSQSNAAKALAIMLIVLGHNSILSPVSWPEKCLFEYLYYFHVYLFFILPFFYNKEIVFSRWNIQTAIVRCMIPYFLFFTFSYLLWHILQDKSLSIREFILGFFDVGEYSIKAVTGVAFLWFLPTFCIVSILRMLSARWKWLPYFIVSVGLVMAFYRPAYLYMWHSSFFVLRAVLYFTMGWCAVHIFRYVPLTGIVGSVLFIAFSWGYFLDIFNIRNVFLFSIAGFCFLTVFLRISQIDRWSLIQVLGKHSLPVYMTHVYIFNALLLFDDYLGGILIYLLTLVISLSLSLLIERLPKIQSFLFPRNWSDWTSSFKKRIAK